MPSVVLTRGESQWRLSVHAYRLSRPHFDLGALMSEHVITRWLELLVIGLAVSVAWRPRR